MLEKHKIDYFFPLALIIFFMKNAFWKGIYFLDTNLKLNTLAIHFSVIGPTNYFSQSKY